MGSTVQRSCQIWADILRILCPLPGPMTWPYPEQQNKAQPSDEKEREKIWAQGPWPGQLWLG